MQKTYPAGVPCWIDSAQPDLDAATHFYGELFGWAFTNAMPPGVPGAYMIATLDGSDVAALAPGDDTSPRTSTAWNTHIAVDDADAMAARVEGLGGAVLEPPEDAGPGGRGATLADPAGVPFRIWQARRRLGAQTVNAPGSWNFSDLHTVDIDGAKRFYGELFGWEADTLDLGGGGGGGGGATATMWRRPGYGDHLAATTDPEIYVRQAGVSAPPGFADAIAWLAPPADGESPHWHVTFSVADRDDAVATALRLGAMVASGPVDGAWSRTAVIRDPQGATFTLSQFTPPE